MYETSEHLHPFNMFNSNTTLVDLTRSQWFPATAELNAQILIAKYVILRIVNTHRVVKQPQSPV